jgi:magnesium-transporting ATPase (P-type)
MPVKHGDEPSVIASTDPRRGLRATEAAAQLERDGPNVLPVSPPPPAWRLLLAQMVHFFAVLLWSAGALAFVAGMPQLGVAIFIVVVINGIFAFAQEYRAERAAERLRDLLPRRATVLRDGTAFEVDARELVAGDVILLSPGDRISADLQVLEAHSLSIDTSTLTGESVPVSVEPEEAALAGTFVVEGEGVAVVTATGTGTRLASIAQLTRASRHPRTPLDRVVRAVAAIAVGVGVVFFVTALFIGTPASSGFGRGRRTGRPEGPSDAPVPDSRAVFWPIMIRKMGDPDHATDASLGYSACGNGRK